MKTKLFSLLAPFTHVGLISIVCLATGCGTPKEKPLQSRGWIGGQVMVVRTFPKSLIPRPKTAILVKELATNTPAAIAGLHAGDLIFALDHQPVTNLRGFRRKIDRIAPDTSLPVTAYRDGQILEYTIVVGRETFRTGGEISIYFPVVVHPWNPWPHGDYSGLSLVALGYQRNGVSRAELGSTERQYFLKCDPTDHPYDENYKIWLGFFEFSNGKRIIEQQMATAK